MLCYFPTNISKVDEERSSRWTSIRISVLRSHHLSDREQVAVQRRTSSTLREGQDPESLTPLRGRATHWDIGRKEEWNLRNLHEPWAPLRGRATHLKTGRLRQKWIRRRRLSKIHLHESMTPFRGQASRGIAHWWQRCDITAHTVLLYVLFCLIYMYCTLYVLYILHTVHIVHVPCFPVSDVEISSSTSVHHLFTLLVIHLVTFT